MEKQINQRDHFNRIAALVIMARHSQPYKYRMLFSLLVSLLILVTLVPQPSQADAGGIPPPTIPVSVSTNSYWCAMLIPPVRFDDYLSKARLLKNDVRGKKTWKFDAVAPGIHEYPTATFLQPSIHDGSLDNVLRTNFRLACLLLDRPPPSGIIL